MGCCAPGRSSRPGSQNLFLSIRAVSWAGTGGAWDLSFQRRLGGRHVSAASSLSAGSFSHETALFFHDLTDRDPLAYSITVKTGYNPTRLKDEGVQVFTIKAELHEVGLTTAQTPFGHDVPVYDMERTICDVLRSRSHIEMQTFQDALKAYARRKDKDLRTLVRYAKLFRVEKILRQYLEVLL